MTGYNSYTRQNHAPRDGRGFALLVAIVLSAVALMVTTALTTLAYKSLILSSAARESQYSFYAADTALECGLFWDNSSHGNYFPYTTNPGGKSIVCGSSLVSLTGTYESSYARTKYQSGWFTVPSGCARITMYKSNSVQYLFADGANVSCSGGILEDNPLLIERGLRAIY